MSLDSQIVEAGKAIVMRRAVDGVFEVASSAMLGDLTPASSSTPGFSVSATAVIALTSAALGGLAGWALHDLFGSKRR